jgi:Kef-type K+ transport system membrane component KefB
LAVIIVVTLTLSILITYYSARTIVKDDAAARQVAVTLGGRGAVGIVIASVALGSGVIDSVTYSLIVLATLVISLIVPVLLGRRQSD